MLYSFFSFHADASHLHSAEPTPISGDFESGESEGSGREKGQNKTKHSIRKPKIYGDVHSERGGGGFKEKEDVAHLTDGTRKRANRLESVKCREKREPALDRAPHTRLLTPLPGFIVLSRPIGTRRRNARSIWRTQLIARRHRTSQSSLALLCTRIPVRDATSASSLSDIPPIRGAPSRGRFF